MFICYPPTLIEFSTANKTHANVKKKKKENFALQVNIQINTGVNCISFLT